LKSCSWLHIYSLSIKHIKLEDDDDQREEIVVNDNVEVVPPVVPEVHEEIEEHCPILH